MSDITWNLDVLIMPRQGVNDPQGDAVRSGLLALGFDTTSKVRVGKRIAVAIEAPDEQEALARGRRMCDQLLANPVIEEYTLAVSRAEEDA